MKKFVSVFLVVMFLFTGIGHAETTGVNLMEFARRYYHMMDIAGVETSEPKNGSTGCVAFDGTVVYFDEASTVTKVLVLASNDDENSAVSLFAVLIALSTPYDEISLDCISSDLLQSDKCGDYDIVTATATNTGAMVMLELK